MIPSLPARDPARLPVIKPFESCEQFVSLRRTLDLRFGITIKQYADCCKAAWLLTYIRYRQTQQEQNVNQAVCHLKVSHFEYALGFSGFTVFKKFSLRIFGLCPSEVVAEIQRAEANLVQHYPVLAPKLLNLLGELSGESLKEFLTDHLHTSTTYYLSVE
jgi:predicted transcriptional regulator